MQILLKKLLTKIFKYGSIKYSTNELVKMVQLKNKGNKN